MRFRTFLVTGVEVLQLGGQRWESNMWPDEHWRENKGRFRLYTVAIDEQVSSAMSNKYYGGPVEGIVIALEVAAFDKWPETTFARHRKVPSFKPKYRDLWCFAKLDWNQIQSLTLKQQFAAYSNAVFESIDRIKESKRKPNGFLVQEFAADLRMTFESMKVSTLTRAANLP